jgi:poly(3-hydroxybutyrate) depolymerase
MFIRIRHCSRMFPRIILAIGVLGVAVQARATTTMRLPDWVCAHPDAIFVDGFQPAAGITRLASNGSGGASGSIMRTVSVAGLGTRNYYLYVPSAYAVNRPLPFVFALHGYTGSSATAPSAAQSVRNTWSSIAESGTFIVAAPIASGSQGDWTLPPSANPTDYDVFAAVIADVESAYNIDRSRRIGWGFSAGGHVMHDLVLNHYSMLVTIDTFAAYGVSAGVLSGLACSSATECNAIVAAASRKIPLDIHVGSTDPLLPYATSDRSVFLANGWVDQSTLWMTTFTGGHVYASAQLGEIWGNLCPFQVLP